MSDKKGLKEALGNVVAKATAKAVIKAQIDKMTSETDKPTLLQLIAAKAIARIVEGVAKKEE